MFGLGFLGWFGEIGFLVGGVPLCCFLLFGIHLQTHSASRARGRTEKKLRPGYPADPLLAPYLFIIPTRPLNIEHPVDLHGFTIEQPTDPVLTPTSKPSRSLSNVRPMPKKRNNKALQRCYYRCHVCSFCPLMGVSLSQL